MKTILVTGAAGLLGSVLSKELVLKGFRVISLVRHLPVNQVFGVEYCTIDFSEQWAESSLPTQVDVIIHLAQSKHYADFPTCALDVFKVNVESTARLLDYAKITGVTKFIYASSGGVYGSGMTAFKEDDPIQKPGCLNNYLSTKVASEMLVQSYKAIFDVIVLRPFFMYGQGQNRNMLIPRLIDSISTGSPILLNGPNGIRINPIHVSDASRSVLAALNLNESYTINIAGSEALSIREICQQIGSFIGVAPVFKSQSIEALDLVGDTSTMSNLLNVTGKPFSDLLCADLFN